MKLIVTVFGLQLSTLEGLTVPYPVICFSLILTTLALTTSPGEMSAKAVEPCMVRRTVDQPNSHLQTHSQ